MSEKFNSVLISGCSGQVGSFLTEMYLERGYKVYGLKRKSSSHNTQRLDHIFDHPNLQMFYADITDYASVDNVISSVSADIMINCAAQSFVAASYSIPIITAQATGIGVLNCLESIRLHSPKTRFITMSSSEMFGSTPGPQNENSKKNPVSPYACAKLFGHELLRNYRESYGLFASAAICFNIESYRRGEVFITKKATKAAARIKMGLQKKLVIGATSPRRDWNAVQDSILAIDALAQADVPDDYCIGSGKCYTVEYFIDRVFSKLGMNWKDHTEISQQYIRPSEVNHLESDSSKIHNALGWKPKWDLEMIIDSMLEHDLKEAEKELIIKGK